MMPFLDTNIFVRVLTGEPPQQARACYDLLRRIERGDLIVWTTALVIAEVVFVLSSKRLYNVERSQIRDLLIPIIELPGIKLDDKRMYRRVFEVYATTPMDYTDAYHVALMEQRSLTSVFSYDKHFDRAERIERLRP